jgi:hypothetical protein
MDINRARTFKNHADFVSLYRCQIFIATGSGIIIITQGVAIMAAAAHQHVAVVIAILGLFGNIGGAIGLTVASAIWQNVLPNKLAIYLPSEEVPNLLMIYGDLTTQLSYPVGSPVRTAIQQAYGDAQLQMLIVGTAAWVLCLGSVLMWRNLNVIGVKQTKGHVF